MQLTKPEWQFVMAARVLALLGVLAALTVSVGVLTGTASAHPGPVDSSGCHFSESEGYHCH